MSLLLDALKKTGDNKQGTGLSNLTLEDAAPSRTASASSTTNASSRAAGETMFAAKKKKPASGGWKLGLVPTTLLIALVFGSGYGYYVWLQIQPPAQPRVVQRTLPPPPPFVVAPIAPAAPALVPSMPPTENVPAAQARSAQPVVTARNEDFDAPRNKPRTARHYGQPADTEISVQRKMKTDNVTPALLDAYQAYQRGDYVTATRGHREVLGNDPHNRDALLGLAAMAQRRRRRRRRNIIIVNCWFLTRRTRLRSRH